MYDKKIDREKLLEGMEMEKHEAPKFKEPVTPPFSLPLLWSGLLSVFSVANPFLSSLATNLQSQNLYAGWAMAQGDVMYGQIYGTSGLLYYLLNWLSNLAFGPIVMAVVQFICLWFAGRFLFQIAYQLMHKENLAKQVLHLFYLLALGLGLGGFYASLFAFPVVFAGIYFILRYVAGEAEDKSFVGFGALLAALFLLDPLTALMFATLAFLVLMVYNIWSKKFAHGLYQWLASILGFSIVFYPLGYITVLNGTFGLAISQITYPLESLSVGSHVLNHAPLYLGLGMGLGVFTAIVGSLSGAKKELEIVLQIFSSLAVVAVLLFSLFLPEDGAYHLLPVLPFLMVLIAIWLGKEGYAKRGRHSSRAEQTHSVFGAYFKKNLLLPVLALLYLIVYPIANHYAFLVSEGKERAQAAAYIKAEAKSGDRIYAWDKTAHLYQESGHLSASALLTPSLYGDTAENRLILAQAITQNHPVYILVHRDLPLLADVQKELKESYQEENLELDHFTLYKLK
ncbi:heme transporter CcmD [Streptococcus pneumoniae]